MSAVEAQVGEAPVGEELTVEELSTRTGISVRNLRFYTTRGLVPPPTKRGRTAVYGPEHLARFELLQELQGHGLTLAAIERFFAGITHDSTPEELALQRVTLRPLSATKRLTESRKELEQRAGRKLPPAQLAKLIELGGVTPTDDGKFDVDEGRMRASLRLLDLNVPSDLVSACNEVYQRHSRAMASELETLFRENLWPAYRSGEISADQLVAMLSNWEQGGIAALVDAFSAAVTEARLAAIERRTR